MAWQLQVGDPSRLAISVAFTPNPDGAQDASSPEESESWGNFTLWVDGENLCAHHELGEVVESCHWYLLPLFEWLAENWNALLHEERFPHRNTEISAAENLALSKTPPLTLKEIDEFDWLATWAAWWNRHNIRAARSGGLFPDLYVRRYRDAVEISAGGDPLPGVPRDFLFVARNRMYRLDLVEASSVLYDVLTAAVAELKRRLPSSDRVVALDGKLRDLKNAETQRLERLAFLSGFPPGVDGFPELIAAVDGAFSEVSPDVKSSILSSKRDHELVTVGTAFARLLYGAMSPEMDVDDVIALSGALLNNYDAGASLGELGQVEARLQAVVEEVAALRPGAQGSALGEAACLVLGDPSRRPVDIEAILDKLRVPVSMLRLSDTNLRAVSVFGESQPPAIFCNSAFSWGVSPGVTRFTLAHELCHLLLDREFGDELAVATGPWAPVDIEQRANAFAAAFLMPTWLLRDEMAAALCDVTDIEDLSRLAATLRVSLSALVDRLYNLGEITSDERWRLRAEVGRGRASSCGATAND